MIIPLTLEECEEIAKEKENTVWLHIKNKQPDYKMKIFDKDKILYFYSYQKLKSYSMWKIDYGKNYIVYIKE